MNKFLHIKNIGTTTLKTKKTTVTYATQIDKSLGLFFAKNLLKKINLYEKEIQRASKIIDVFFLKKSDILIQIR